VVDQHGAVWWALFSSGQSDWRLAERWVEQLRAQIDGGRETFVFVSGDTCWRTRLHAIEYDEDKVEPELVPNYYAEGSRRHLWLKISDFEPLERDDLLRLLDPVNHPGKPVALGNQTNPLIVRLRTTPRIWWVNQGASFNRARQGGYLWAPVLDKSGRTHDHWQAMRQLRRGDIVLNYANTQIRAWSNVGGEATPSARPDPEADQSWNDEGYRADIAYHVLSSPVNLGEIPSDWRTSEGGPFTKDGAVKQGYLFQVSDKFAARLRQRFSQLDFAFDPAAGEKLESEFSPESPSTRGALELELEAVRKAADARGLRLSDHILAQVVAAIRSGKHVILTGPPGTAKTTLAELLASVASEAGVCEGYLLTTATADWTTYETIGGLKPTAGGGLSFQEGHFLDAIRNNQWLVIDELNRSNFDRAFGQLFTVLSGQAVELPYERQPGKGRVALVPAGAIHGFVGADVLEIPKAWRVIATMNVFDKSLLFEMSFALMRRFAFVEVPSPALEDFEVLLAGEAKMDATALEVATQMLALRSLKDLGPAVYMDLARFARERRAVSDISDGDLAYEAFYSYLLPQFEGIDEVQGERLYREVKKLVGSANAERLRRTLVAVLGIESLAEPPYQNAVAEDAAELDPPEIELEIES
jgi:MoxR-like ATPase